MSISIFQTHKILKCAFSETLIYPPECLMVITLLVIDIFHETCTIGFSKQLSIHTKNMKILKMVYFLIAGHIYSYTKLPQVDRIAVYFEKPSDRERWGGG